MERPPRTNPSPRGLVFAAALSAALAGAAPARALPSYGPLINAFCTAEGRDPATPYGSSFPSQCQLCHQPGFFDRDPAHQVQPNAQEFVNARDGQNGVPQGDYSFFCPAMPATNAPPAFDPVSPQAGAEGLLLRFDLRAVDPDGDSVSIAGANLPSGATLTDAGDGTAVFSWTPGPGQAGSYTVTFTATDDYVAPAASSIQVSLTIDAPNRAPVLSVPASRSIDEGQTLSVSITAQDPDGDPVTLSASNLPTGADFSEQGAGTGLLTWTPSFGQAGSYTVVFLAADNQSPRATSSAELVISVGDVNRPPVLTAPTAATVLEGETLMLLVTATDPDTDPVTLSAANLPTGATFEDGGLGAATLVFTPSFGQAGRYEVTVTATDSGTPPASDSATFTITVGDVNRPPVLAPIGNRVASEGIPLEIVVSATDPDGDALGFAAGDLPAGATFEDRGDGSASLRWTPAFGDAGSHTITVSVTDDGSPMASDSETFTIDVGDVNRPPVLAAIGNQVIAEGESLDLTLTATDPDGDAVSFSAAGVPPGAVFEDRGDGSASFRWTPAFGDAGNHEVTFTVTDAGQPPGTDSETVTVTVGEVNRPPMLAPVGNRSVDEGAVLEIVLTASDPDGDALRFTAEGVPEGATFRDLGDGTARFRFEPGFDRAGTYPVTFRVADDGNPAESDSESVTITVVNVNRAPVLAPVGTRTVAEGALIEIALQATDPDGDPLLFSASGLPANATLADNGDGSARFSWMPLFGSAGTVRVTFTVTDAGVPALSASEEVAIRVTDVNRAPVLAPIGPQGATVGMALELRIQASDPDGDALTLSASGLPAGASFSDAGDGSGTFRFTPSAEQVGTHSVLFRATDLGAPPLSDEESVTITVAAEASDAGQEGDADAGGEAGMGDGGTGGDGGMGEGGQMAGAGRPLALGLGSRAQGALEIPGFGLLRVGQELPLGTARETHPAWCNLDADPEPELVVGFGDGGRGRMEIYDDATTQYALLRVLELGWIRYAEQHGAVFPACGDTDGDGRDEIAAGLGQGGGAWLRIYDDAMADFAPMPTPGREDGWLFTGWHTYGARHGATYPAFADLDGDDRSELAIAFDAGSHGWLLVLDDGTTRFAPYGSVPRGDGWLRLRGDGARIARCDLDGDGRDQLVLGLEGGTLLLLEPAGGRILRTLDVPWEAYASGDGPLHPACGDLDGNGSEELLVGFGPGGMGYYARFDATGAPSGPPQPGAPGWYRVADAAYAGGRAPVFPAIARTGTRPAGGDGGMGDAGGEGGMGDGGMGGNGGMGEGGQMAGGTPAPRALVVFGLGRRGLGAVDLRAGPGAFQPLDVARSVSSGAERDTRVALCDVDGDARPELVVGFGRKSGGRVNVYDDAETGFAYLRQIRVGWKDYDAANGETEPACGDLDADGRDEIVVALGEGGDTWLRFFDDSLTRFAPLPAGGRADGWYDVGWRRFAARHGGVRPTVGDADGDGRDELVLGFGPTADGWMLALRLGEDGLLQAVSPTPHPGGWFRLDADDTRAVFCDVEPGGGRELVVAAEEGRLLILDPRDGFAELGSRELPREKYLEAYLEEGGELWPACGDVDGDGLEELLVGLDGPGQGYYAVFDGESAPSGPPGEGAPGWERLNHPIYNQVDGATRPAISRDLTLPPADASESEGEGAGSEAGGEGGAAEAGEGSGGEEEGGSEAGGETGEEQAPEDTGTDTGNDDDGEEGDGGSSAGQAAFDNAASLAAFTETVHPITVARCSACHAGFGPGSPSLAAADPMTAFRAVLDNQKVHLLEPERSRLVRRLAVDRHFCWSDCDADAETMRAAIADWAERIGATGGMPALPPDALATSSLSLADGVETERSARSDDAVIARWTFEEGSGPVARDTSGVAPAIDLDLEGVNWIPGGGIEIVDGRAQAGPETARKLYDRIANPLSGTNEYSIEAWVTPANTDQEGPARIVSYSRDTSRRNFTMGQVRYNYVFRNRSRAPGISANGTPGLYTADGDQDLQATLQHVVMTFDQEHGRRIYVNGRFTDDVDPKGPGALDTWDPRYSFLLGNERTGNRLWKGRIHFVAIHERALDPDEISRNFLAGVGKTFVLRFDISRWTGLAGSAIEIEVGEFDAASYLFSRPTYVGPAPGALSIRNIRIAVNGQVPVAGQAFRSLDAVVTDARQELSPLASVIAVDRGPEEDRFALLFEVLGDNRAEVAESDAPVIPGGFSDERHPRVGMRTFSRIHQTMAALTGVDPTTREIRETFEEIKQQLPSSSDVRTFVSSHQVAVFKLALEYCDALIDSGRLRDAFFGADPRVPFAEPVGAVFGNPELRRRILDTTVDRFFGTELADQPAREEVRPILDELVDTLLGSCTGEEPVDDEACGSDRTSTVAKSVCSAVLSSAPVLLY